MTEQIHKKQTNEISLRVSANKCRTKCDLISRRNEIFDLQYLSKRLVAHVAIFKKFSCEQFTRFEEDCRCYHSDSYLPTVSPYNFTQYLRISVISKTSGD